MGRVSKTVRFDPEILAWIEAQIESKRFASISHAIDVALTELKNKETRTSSQAD